MNTYQRKITLPKDLQIKMMNFFLKTSILRKKKQKNKINSLSENQNR